MSAAICGKTGTVNVNAAAVLETTGWNLSRVIEPIDVSSQGSAGNRERKPGMLDFNGSFEALVFVDLTAGGPYAFSFLTGDGGTTYSGSLLITDVTTTVTFDDKVVNAYSFDGHGALGIA